MTADDGGPVLVARVLTFDGDLPSPPEGYKDNFDMDLASAAAQSLMAYLERYSKEHDRQIEFSRNENDVDGKKEDGSSISITCYPPELFDLQRWPSGEEVDVNGRVIYDFAAGLDKHFMITLARRYIINGHLDD